MVSKANYLIGANVAILVMFLLILPLTIICGMYLFKFGNSGSITLSSSGAKILGGLTLIIPIIILIIAIIVFIVNYSIKKPEEPTYKHSIYSGTSESSFENDIPRSGYIPARGYLSTPEYPEYVHPGYSSNI